MNEKTKKLMMAVFTAIASLIVSCAACALGIPVDGTSSGTGETGGAAAIVRIAD